MHFTVITWPAPVRVKPESRSGAGPAQVARPEARGSLASGAATSRPKQSNRAAEQSEGKKRKAKQSGPAELQKCHFHWRSRRGRRQNGRLRAGGASGGGEEVASRPGEGSVCVSRALCSRCSLLAARRSLAFEGPSSLLCPLVDSCPFVAARRPRSFIASHQLQCERSERRRGAF